MSALSRCASASFTLDFKRPAAKIGCETCGTKLQALCGPLSFRSDELRSLLLRSQIATLDELKHALGTSVDVTVFRKLKPLDYLTSYSHRGRYYTLHEIAHFDEKGLWSHANVWFSQFGTLLASAESFVNRSPRGYFAEELARDL